MNKSIVFLLLGEKAHYVLSRIVDNNRALIGGVVVGRDSKLSDDYAEKIVQICQKNNIPFVERHAGGTYLNNHNGYFMLIGWRWLAHVDERKLIVLHDSLLPKYRGFAPLVSALINGESVVGATALFGAQAYDRGDIIIQESVSISYPIKISEAIKIISDVYLYIVEKILERIDSNKELVGTPQNETWATYSLWRDEVDYFVDWRRDAKEISRFIDAVGRPYEGAQSFINQEIVVIHEAEPIKDVLICDRRSAVGKVIFIEDDFPVIVCGSGLLKITNMKTVEGMSLLPLKKFRSRFTLRA